MKSVVKNGYIILSILFIIYLLLPNPSFPKPLPGAFQSIEPGDTETPLRRAYYTNLTRQEVLDHYQKQFSRLNMLGISVPTYRLNYPPEEAQILVRDQTRSTFLEEIVHPFRESIFINGFKPSQAKDVIEIEGVKWEQKITVRLIPSNVIARSVVGVISLVICYFLINQWVLLIKDIKIKDIKKGIR